MIMRVLFSLVTFTIIVGVGAFSPLHDSKSLRRERTVARSNKFSFRFYSGSYDSFDGLTIPQLKEELRSRGLKVGGKKSELMDRLKEYEESSTELLGQSLNDVESSVEAKLEEPSSNILEDNNASFEDLGIMRELLRSIDLQNWEDPTPIQRLVIPHIMKEFKASDSSQCSLWAEAPTGSGKTGAFVIPMIQLTLENRKEQRNRAMQANSYLEEDAANSKRKKVGRSRKTRIQSDGSEQKGFVSTLILSPTRELALQIGGVVEELVEGMISSDKEKDRIDVVVITGGVPREAQIQMLTERKLNGRNIDILIATPGRLTDVLMSSTTENSVEKELESRLLSALDNLSGNSKNDVSLSLAQLEELNINKGIAERDDGGRSAIKDMLSNIQYLVLDEADRLLSMGFKTEMDDVLKLMPATRDYDEESSSLKTLLFSATFSEQIQPRVEKVLQRLSGKGAPSPFRLSCSNTVMDNSRELSKTQLKKRERTTQPQAILKGPASTIHLRSIRMDVEDRAQVLRRLLSQHEVSEWDRVLVFVDTRYGAEHVAKKLRRYNIRASELHGKLDQAARLRRLDDFKKGKIRVLLATDLASRGLDVQGLPVVINYDLPRSTSDFVHRIGRTGRAGNKGEAITFITSINEAHYDLIEKRHLGKGAVEREVLPGFEPNEEKWEIKKAATTIQLDGVKHSDAGLAHDRMFGGIKGKRKSKKDRIREKAAKEAVKNIK